MLSDTHGRLPPGALDALHGAEIILHAGDVGGPEVLAALSALAPVAAVRGNVDRGPWALDLPRRREVTVGQVRMLLVHDLADAGPSPTAVAAVIHGHSHRPSVRFDGRVLYLNPGSAGPRRFRLPVTLARLRVRGASLLPEIVTLVP